jgi:hypothetical protein
MKKMHFAITNILLLLSEIGFMFVLDEQFDKKYL